MRAEEAKVGESQKVIRKDRETSFLKTAYVTPSSQRLIKSRRGRENQQPRKLSMQVTSTEEERTCVCAYVCVSISKPENVYSANHMGGQQFRYD